MMNTESLYRKPSEDELLRYEIAVQKALDEKNPNLICNSSLEHAAIILKLLCSAARESICIFCGRMRRAVYGDILHCIQDAVKRGVTVRIVTEKDQADVETQELARQGEGWEWRSLKKDVNIPHLVLVDDDKFRLELNAHQGEAIVCTGVSKNDKTRHRMIDTFRTGFDRIWAAAQSC